MKPITSRNDAFGLEMWACYKGGPPFEIVERDDGYIDAANSTGQYFAEFKDWPERQKRGMKFVRGDNALDVGCGAGRVSLFLQSKGIHVTAIDSSPLAVRISKKRGVKKARVVPFEGIERIRENGFTTVVMFGNNFGLFANVRKAKRLLKRLHRMTTERAVLIAETANPYRTTNALHRQYQRRNRQRGRMGGQLRIRIRFQSIATPWFDFLSVSPNEMKHILTGTGWKVTRFIEGGKRSYVAVIEKVTA